MPSDNLVLCYEGVQRVYRNAVVRYLRSRMTAAFGDEAVQRLKKPFKAEEWEKTVASAAAARVSGQLAAAPLDEFDLLSVNHFFNLFDSYWDRLLPASVAGAAPEVTAKARKTLLEWMREIKDLRDPLSHPTEADFSLEDSFRLLDCARRVMDRLELSGEAEELRQLVAKVLHQSSATEREPLELRVPPRESIVVDFVGRKKQLQELWDWFDDPIRRRWALAGDGGKGKSAIAYQFAVDVAQKAPPPFQTVLWMSAKRRRFVEGTVVSIDNPDFVDLDSALSSVLRHYGWVEEVEHSTEGKRGRVLELLKAFPALLIVDDVDSLEAENEDVVEFFSLQVPETNSKVLFTSRRTIFGMGGTTTHVSGFGLREAIDFITSRCELLELDPASFDKETVRRIVEATDGSPLYVEDLMRFSASVCSVPEAISLWKQRDGNEARRYALGRECDRLSPAAKSVLMAASVSPEPVSFPELEGLTGASRETITVALNELQRLFLVPKPRLIEGEQRFEVNVNTKALVRDVYGADAAYQRSEAAYRAISLGVVNLAPGAVGTIVRQATFLVRGRQHVEAEKLLLNALEKYPSNPDLISFLGWIYKAWQPPRTTDAREQFRRAWQLKCAKLEMYGHWCFMEVMASEWQKAIEAAEKGLKLLPGNKVLLYWFGRASHGLGRELMSRLISGKATDALAAARRSLEAALKAPNSGQWEMDPKIYRCLVYACEGTGDVGGMRHFLYGWRRYFPDDAQMHFEWDRLTQKYHIDEKPAAETGESV